VDPQPKLGSSALKIPAVYLPHERGLNEVSAASVIAKIHHRIELALRDYSPHRVIDAGDGLSQIPLKQFLSFRLGDGLTR
jgi:hypothetical protein